MSKLWICAVATLALLWPSLSAAQTSTPAPETSRAGLIRYLDDIAKSKIAARRVEVGGLRSRSDVERRQAKVRAQILDLIGGLPTRTAPLNPETTGRGDGDGFRTENVVFDSMPGQHVTATLFLPKTGQTPVPAVVIAPGHSPTGRRGDYSIAANFARNGVAALTYDIVGEGERLQYYDAQIGASRVGRPTGEHSMAAFHGWLLDGHVARYFIFDAMSALDYLQQRPEIDGARLGAFGCSGGGTVTAYIAALDARVKAAASACYVNDFEHLLAGPGPQDAEQSIQDFLKSGLDLPDWIELAAPKPYAVVSTTEDMFPLAGAQAAVEDAKPFWAAFGAADRFEWITGPGGHGALDPIEDKIIGFFLSAFEVSVANPIIAPQRPANLRDMLASPTGQIGGATLASINQEAAASTKSQPGAGSLAATIRATARIEAMPGPAPKASTMAQGARPGLSWTSLSFPSDRGLLQAQLVRPTAGADGKVALLLDPASLDTLGRPGGRLDQLALKGWTVLAIQARGADGAEEIKAALVGDQNLLALRAHLVGKTLLGLRVDDAIAALNWLAVEAPGPVTVVGVGASGLVALHTAALDDRVAAVRLEASQLSYRLAASRPIQRDLPAIVVPGVLTVYDLPDLMSAIAPRPLVIVNPLDPVAQPLAKAELDTVLGHVHAANVTLLPYVDAGW